MVRRTWQVILVCGLFLGLTACSPSGGKLSTADVQVLLQRLNSSPLGLTVTADDTAVTTELLRGESGRFLIRLDHPRVSFNTGLLRELDDSIPLLEFPMGMEELVLVYGPEDDYCALRSAAGLTVTLDESVFDQVAQAAEAEGEELQQVSMTYRIGKIESNDYDMSLLLNPEEQDIQEIFVGLLSANATIQAAMTDFQLEVLIKDEEGRLNVAVDHASSRASVHPDLMTLFLSSGETGSIVSSLFSQKDPFFEIDYQMDGIELSLSTPEEDVKFHLEGIDINNSALPTADGSTFRFGFGWDVRGMSSEGIKEKDTAALTQAKRLNLEFSVDGLPSGFLEAYLKLLKAVQSFGAERDPSELEGLQTQAMGLTGHIMQAKPIIKLKVSPLDHAYGRLEADASFQIVGMRPPVGRAAVTISDIEGLREALERDQILPAERLGAFMEWLGKLFEVDESGRGTLTFEIKEEDPSHFYLNGKPQKFE